MKYIRYLFALGLLTAPLPASADYLIKDGNGVPNVVKAFNCSGSICPQMTPVNSVGAAFGVTGNPFYVVFPSAQAVTGTFYQATQPVSIATMPTTPVTGTFWQTTQPVSGTFWQTTQPISAASLPLPTLAATSTLQTSGGQKSQIVDGSANIIGSTSNALDVNIKSGFGTSIAVTNTGTFAVQAVLGAETTKVIGTVNQGTSPWVVSNGGTFATQSAITAVSAAFASGALASGSIASGAMVDLGSQADASCGTATGTCSLIALTKYLNTSVNSPIATQASTVFIGGVGTQPLGATITDRSMVNGTTTSQAFIGANSSRHSLIIQNIGTANCGINPTGGTAAIGSAGTLTLVPNGSYQPTSPTKSAITSICVTTTSLYAEES